MIMEKGLLACGITKETIEQWSQDIQVTIMDDEMTTTTTTTTPSGKTISIFDTLEDLDADDSLTKVSNIQ